MAGVPLVAITADRPPELQHCGASQTIDQVKLYGGFVRAAFDLGPPGPGELALRAVRRKVAQALTARVAARTPARSTSSCRCASRWSPPRRRPTPSARSPRWPAGSPGPCGSPRRGSSPTPPRSPSSPPRSPPSPTG